MPRGRRALRYLGYAPTLDVLADYQIGLVTISDDPLRRLSFSSKQLEYFSYGLPVLVPAWRPDELLAAGTVLYTEETFLNQVKILGDSEVWQATSSRALEVAQRFSWDAALQPLTALLGS
jgi:glucuronate isomerase